MTGDVPSAGEIVAGRYRVQRTLGTGASGTVLEVVHEVTGKTAALKWMHPHLAAHEPTAARFLRESRAASAVDHPNVVTVLDAGRDRDTLYLVSEKLDGMPLSQLFRGGPLRAPVVIQALLPALAGLEAVHARGIVHRDLKPDNVFLVRPRPGWPATAKVLDFGISKLHSPEGEQELTSVGALLGSPYYMAPEQILDSKNVDLRVDVYAVGVMLYEGIAGYVPFDGETLLQIAELMKQGPRPIDRPDVPPALREVIRRALSRDRDARFASAAELAKALEPFCGGATLTDAIAMAEGAASMSFEGDVTQVPGGAQTIVRDSNVPTAPRPGPPERGFGDAVTVPPPAPRHAQPQQTSPAQTGPWAPPPPPAPAPEPAWARIARESSARTVELAKRTVSAPVWALLTGAFVIAVFTFLLGALVASC